MNGKAWVISCYVGMLEHGEADVTGEQVATIANRLFQSMRFPAFPDDAEREIAQQRKHLVFLRDPCVKNPPSVQELLFGAIIDGTNRRKDAFGRDLIRVANSLRGSTRRSFRHLAKEQGWVDVRKSLFEEPGPTFGTPARLPANSR